MPGARPATLAVLSLVLLTGCLRPQGMARAARSGALGALPADSVALVVLEVGDLKAREPRAAWLEDLSRAADREGPFSRIRDLVGPASLEGIDRIGIAVVPLPGPRVGYGAVAEGDFDAVLREAVGADGVRPLPGPNEPDFAVGITSGGDLAFGPRSVVDVIRRNAAAEGSGLAKNQALLGALAALRPGPQLWGAIDCRGLFKTMRDAAGARGASIVPPAAADPIDALSSLAFQGRVGEEIEFDILARAQAGKDAARLADAVRGLLAIARLGANGQEAATMRRFLDAVTVGQTKDVIALHGIVPKEALAALGAKAHEVGAVRPSAGVTPAPAARRP